MANRRQQGLRNMRLNGNSWYEIAFLVFIVFLVRTFGFGIYQVPTGSMETTMLVGERFFADKATYLFRSPCRGEIISFNDPLFNYSSSRLISLFQHYIWGPSNWTKRVIGIPGDTVRGIIEDGKPVIYVNDEKLVEPYINKYPLVISFYEDPEMNTLAEDIEQATIPYTYDPSMPFGKQPFYKLKENRLLRDEKTGDLILLQPDTPLIRDEKYDQEYREGINYWNCTDDFLVKLGKNQYWVMGDNRKGSRDSRFIGPLQGDLIHGRIIFRIFSVDSEYHWWIFDILLHPLDFFSRIRKNRCLQFIH